MKHIETNTWAISIDRENFFNSYSSRDDAIQYLREKYGEGYVGRYAKFEFDENDISYDETSYYLKEKLFSEVGDFADNWEMTREEEIELSKILAKEVIKFINEHDLQPTCVEIVEIERVLAGEQE